MRTTDESEKELADYFQAHKQDEGEWSDEAVEAVVVRPTSVVYSVRFSSDELSKLKRIALRMGVTVSELIRSSVLQHVRESREPVVEFGAPYADKVVVFSRTEPRRAGTYGAKELPLASTAR